MDSQLSGVFQKAVLLCIYCNQLSGVLHRCVSEIYLVYLLVVNCQMCCRNVLCVSASSQLCTCFRNILSVSAGSQCVRVSEVYFVYLLVLVVSCPCVSEIMYLVYQLSIMCFRNVPCVSIVPVFQKCTLCISCPCVSELYLVYQLFLCFRKAGWSQGLLNSMSVPSSVRKSEKKTGRGICLEFFI